MQNKHLYVITAIILVASIASASAYYYSNVMPKSTSSLEIVQFHNPDEITITTLKVEGEITPQWHNLSIFQWIPNSPNNQILSLSGNLQLRMDYPAFDPNAWGRGFSWQLQFRILLNGEVVELPKAEDVITRQEQWPAKWISHSFNTITLNGFRDQQEYILIVQTYPSNAASHVRCYTQSLELNLQVVDG